jgi:hypothetical protein
VDVRTVVAEQIALGHKAGELLANPAFKQVVDDLAIQYYKEFMSAQMHNPSELLMARLKAIVLEEIVDTMTQMYDVGKSNSQNMKG